MKTKICQHQWSADQRRIKRKFMVPALIKQVVLGQCDGDLPDLTQSEYGQCVAGSSSSSLAPACLKAIKLCFYRYPVLLPFFAAQISNLSPASCNWEKWCAPCSLFKMANAYISLLFSLQTILILSMALMLPSSGILFVWNLKLEFVQREQRVLKISTGSHLWLKKPSFGS